MLMSLLPLWAFRLRSWFIDRRIERIERGLKEWPKGLSASTHWPEPQHGPQDFLVLRELETLWTKHSARLDRRVLECVCIKITRCRAIMLDRRSADAELGIGFFLASGQVFVNFILDGEKVHVWYETALEATYDDFGDALELLVLASKQVLEPQ